MKPSGQHRHHDQPAMSSEHNGDVKCQAKTPGNEQQPGQGHQCVKSLPGHGTGDLSLTA